MSFFKKWKKLQTHQHIIMRGIQKVCNSTIKKNTSKVNYSLFFNTVTAKFNAFVPLFWKNVPRCP